MLVDEIINHLQNLTQQRIAQKDLGDALGVSKQAIANKKADNYHFKEYEIEKIKKYILEKYKNDVCTIIDKNEPSIILDYYPEVFGSCGTGVFELSQTKEFHYIRRDMLSRFLHICKKPHKPYKEQVL